MSTGGTIATALFWLVVAAAFLVVIVRAIRRWRRESAECEAAEQMQRQEAAAAGEMSADGRWLCVVCKHALADHPWPRIDIHWLDRVPLLNRLYSLTPRYSVDDGGDSKALCLAHFRMVTRRLEQALSKVRARTAEFNAGIEQELARLESGELLEWARAEHMRASEMIAMIRPSSGPLLTQGTNASDTPVPGAIGTVTVTPKEDG